MRLNVFLSDHDNRFLPDIQDEIMLLNEKVLQEKEKIKKMRLIK